MTYDLIFSMASSAPFGTTLTTVLSTPRSLIAVSSRNCTSSSLLSPTTLYNSQPVPKIQRQKPSTDVSVITLAMENAISTGFISTQSGTFLRSVRKNREVTTGQTCSMLNFSNTKTKLTSKMNTWAGKSCSLGGAIWMMG